MMHFGTLIYFLIWIPMHLAHHSWLGMLLGVIGAVLWWMIVWWTEFGTPCFWRG